MPSCRSSTSGTNWGHKVNNLLNYRNCLFIHITFHCFTSVTLYRSVETVNEIGYVIPWRLLRRSQTPSEWQFSEICLKLLLSVQTIHWYFLVPYKASGSPPSDSARTWVASLSRTEAQRVAIPARSGGARHPRHFWVWCSFVHRVTGWRLRWGFSGFAVYHRVLA